MGTLICPIYINFAKTQGILFAQVVNSLMLKVKDIAIFASKISIFFPEARKDCQVSFVYVCNSHKLYKLEEGIFVVGQG